MAFNVREATIEDADGIFDYFALLREEAPYIGSSSADSIVYSRDAQVEFLKNKLAHSLENYWVVEANNKIIGGMDLRHSGRNRTRHKVVFGMGIIEGYRGQGIGTAMMAVVLEYCRSHPEILKVELSVIEPNLSALALYKKFGFKEEGRLDRGFRADDGRLLSEIIMGLWVG